MNVPRFYKCLCLLVISSVLLGIMVAPLAAVLELVDSKQSLQQNNKTHAATCTAATKTCAETDRCGVTCCLSCLAMLSSAFYCYALDTKTYPVTSSLLLPNYSSAPEPYPPRFPQ